MICESKKSVKGCKKSERSKDFLHPETDFEDSHIIMRTFSVTVGERVVYRTRWLWSIDYYHSNFFLMSEKCPVWSSIHFYQTLSGRFVLLLLLLNLTFWFVSNKSRHCTMAWLRPSREASLWTSSGIYQNLHLEIVHLKIITSSSSVWRIISKSIKTSKNGQKHPKNVFF